MAAVSALMLESDGAESALRSALAVVSADEAREIGAIVVLLRPGHIPQLFWSSLDQAGASMAATRVSMLADEIMRERMEEGGY